MPYSLIDIGVVQRNAHKSLPNRVVGTVRAVLKEIQDDREQDHELAVSVWAQTDPDMSEQDIEMALLLKAADIVGRVKTSLERSDRPVGPP
ncbi:hypothetical protein PSQ19_15900 [Devosia algicola]|uniref:Uncharacterized protein n=1 Tax=Devosia algicola TaxID=3026418 RepID=A0ABY7YLS6_9HYPH|nr:hypothetical protein [Devosia algicola]WDR02128.1 hypothetical protein PSQ19_15900 [Devosia algicola]